MSMSKQDLVVKLVQEGIHTRQEIKDAVGCTSGAFATYLTSMRNAAKFTGAEICPIEEEKEIDGVVKKVFVVTTFQAAEEARAERAATNTSTAAAKTPAERLDAAQKRIARCESAVDRAIERSEAAEDNVELQLRAEKAQIELKLAEIELERAKALVAEDEANEGDSAGDDEPEQSDDDLI